MVIIYDVGKSENSKMSRCTAYIKSLVAPSKNTNETWK